MCFSIWSPAGREDESVQRNEASSGREGIRWRYPWASDCLRVLSHNGPHPGISQVRVSFEMVVLPFVLVSDSFFFIFYRLTNSASAHYIAVECARLLKERF